MYFLNMGSISRQSSSPTDWRTLSHARMCAAIAADLVILFAWLASPKTAAWSDRGGALASAGRPVSRRRRRRAATWQRPALDGTWAVRAARPRRGRLLSCRRLSPQQAARLPSTRRVTAVPPGERGLESRTVPAVGSGAIGQQEPRAFRACEPCNTYQMDARRFMRI